MPGAISDLTSAAIVAQFRAAPNNASEREAIGAGTAKATLASLNYSRSQARPLERK
jgi:hypothetical protein